MCSSLFWLREYPREAVSPSPSAHYVRSHLSQRERQEHCRKLFHGTSCFSDELYGLAPPSGELARERLRGFFIYTAPKIVALYGARGALPVKTRLWPRHRLEEVPSLSSFHCPAGKETVQAVSVGL